MGSTILLRKPACGLTGFRNHRTLLPVRVVDLTQPLGPQTVVWPGRPAPAFEFVESHDRHGAFSQMVTLFEHSGTHIDAPRHFVDGAPTVDQISAEDLIRPLAVVDVHDRTADDRDYCLSVADLERDEVDNGAIQPGSVVVIHTGWGRRSHDQVAYLGLSGDGALHFPGVAREAAEWLVSRARVTGIGIDTAGIDPGAAAQFDVHANITLPRGIWHLEGLVNLELLPARGATVFVGAIPLTGGSGAPARVIAVVFDPERKDAMLTRPVYRITTFVPPDHVDSLLEGVERVVPLVFGQYESCAWWSGLGVEQFRPLPGSTPTVGAPGRTERVPSVRLEFAIPRDPELLERVLSHGVIPNHPWEEPAVFIDESLATASMMTERPECAESGCGSGHWSTPPRR
jgi:kynurenine formamidase